MGPYEHSEARESARIQDQEPHLATVPIKTTRHPLGLMLLLPISTHVVVVPVEQIVAPSEPGEHDDVWRCLVVQSENWAVAQPQTFCDVSRSALRRSVQMTAVVGSSHR